MEILLALTFVLGYAAIAFEHSVNVNKAASALITGVVCWTIYMLFNGDAHAVNHELEEHLGEVAGILFFLLGAMVIVELVDAHDGFQIITDRIKTTSPRKLLWIIGFITFFLSAVLDNLTTTIVMISLLRKIVDDPKDRLFFAGITVIAANAGGAWSPIGDVTTTMLWIGGQISVGAIVTHVFLPSVACLAVPLLYLNWKMKVPPPVLPKVKEEKTMRTSAKERNLVFALGVGGLLFVPIFKTLTHLPPYMGILIVLGVLWTVTELLHHKKNVEEKGHLTVVHALQKVDAASVLFFLGILLAISSLASAGMLTSLAQWLDKAIGNQNVIVVAIGLLSAVVDNVPLVAAGMGMYPMEQFPQDHSFWLFLAYCAGTGGSCLIIGSAAGVAAMGMEKIDFFWYLKKISLLALLGYFAGVAVYLLQGQLFG
ncbi:MAG: sodium:proton antiporter NhaD [Saprospiraceae bacterium]|jgi:Na+/H+ antiporter NhaD/arsenite permease-like protein|nr:sodium:proton antiporter NhaD [Saprospiraceae bacterium]